MINLSYELFRVENSSPMHADNFFSQKGANLKSQIVHCVFFSVGNPWLEYKNSERKDNTCRSSRAKTRIKSWANATVQFSISSKSKDNSKIFIKFKVYRQNSNSYEVQRARHIHKHIISLSSLSHNSGCVQCSFVACVVYAGQPKPLSITVMTLYMQTSNYFSFLYSKFRCKNSRFWSK